MDLCGCVSGIPCISGTSIRPEWNVWPSVSADVEGDLCPVIDADTCAKKLLMCQYSINRDTKRADRWSVFVAMQHMTIMLIMRVLS